MAHPKDQDPPAGPWVVAGLGNPGRRYENTRHNCGVRALDVLAAGLGLRLKRARPGIHGGEALSGGVRLVVGRPTTYMNESGPPVAALARWYGVPAERLIVVHDEIDLPEGAVRVKFGGGTAGHRGLDSIAGALGTRNFYRVRIGVGRPPGAKEAADYVLARVDKRSAEALGVAEAEAADAVLSLVHDGLEKTMARFHARLRPEGG